MAFEKPQRYQSVNDLEPDATAEFAVDVRLNRLEKRLFRWLRVLTFAVLAALVVATWAIAYNFMVGFARGTLLHHNLINHRAMPLPTCQTLRLP